MPTARVNGRETPILPANYAFRAVAVPAGPVILELSYWPPALTPGLWVTALSLLAAIALVRLGAQTPSSGSRPERAAAGPSPPEVLK